MIKRNKMRFLSYSIYFWRFEKDINNNMFNESFLWEYHSKLDFHLQQVFDIDKTLCCFLDDNFYYTGRDWHTGEIRRVSQTELIEYRKKLKMDEIKKKQLGSFPSEQIKK